VEIAGAERVVDEQQDDECMWLKRVGRVTRGAAASASGAPRAACGCDAGQAGSGALIAGHAALLQARRRDAQHRVLISRAGRALLRCHYASFSLSRPHPAASHTTTTTRWVE
jgi:hypothetical protein